MKALDRRDDRRAVRGFEVGVAAAGRHRNIQRVPSTRARADFARGARPGVVRKLMARNEEDRGIRVERRLCPIAVMDVDVHDRDAIDTLSAQRRRSDRDVVVETESHRAFGFRVMAGRPHERERRLACLPRVSGRVDSGAGGEHGHGVRLGAGERVRVEHRRPAGRRRDPIEVRRAVHALEFLARRRARRLHGTSALGERRGHRVEHFGAFRPLGMARRRDVFRELRRSKQDHGRRSISRARRLEPDQRLGEPLPILIDHRRAGLRRDIDRFADGDRHVAPRLRHLVPIPAVHRPETARLDVKREERIAGRAGEPHGARLNDACRTARTVDAEGRRMAVRHVVAQLDESARAASRRGPARGAVPESADQPRDPLAVEVLARDDDDPAIAEVQRGRENASVPEREDRPAALALDVGEMRLSLLAPRVGAAERFDDRRANRRDRRRLDVLSTRERHRPSYWGPSPPSGGTQSMI